MIIEFKHNITPIFKVDQPKTKVGSIFQWVGSVLGKNWRRHRIPKFTKIKPKSKPNTVSSVFRFQWKNVQPYPQQLLSPKYPFKLKQTCPCQAVCQGVWFIWLKFARTTSNIWILIRSIKNRLNHKGLLPQPDSSRIHDDWFGGSV